MSGRFFKWVIEIEVAPTWVEDGFNLTEERAKTMMENALPYSYGHETRVRVLKAPKPEAIEKAQGGS